MTDHRCAASGCLAQIPYGKLMCLAHWRRVPRHLRAQVLEDWNHGSPRVNYRHTRKNAIAAVNRVLASEARD